MDTDNDPPRPPHPRAASPQTAAGWRIVLNPVSEDTDHGDHVRQLADEQGYTIDETKEEGDVFRSLNIPFNRFFTGGVLACLPGDDRCWCGPEVVTWRC